MNDLVTFQNLGSFDRIELSTLSARGCPTDDLDHHAGLYKGIELKLMQLGEGAFEGRLFLDFSDNISIHLSVCKQSVEQYLVADTNRFVFCISRTESCGHSVFGNTQSDSWVFVLPPCGEAVAVTPANAPFLIMAIDQDLLLQSNGLLGETATWFRQLGPEGDTIESQALQERLLSDAFLRLQRAEVTQAQEQAGTMDLLSASNIANSLSLEWLKTGGFKTAKKTAALERFLKARRVVRQNPHNLTGNSQHAIFEFGSKRSVEQAFADRVDMGPLSYARLVRLHNARRKLRDEKYQRESIGNIAAQEGFWEWSRFTSYYSKHFGELPSQTRENESPGDPCQQVLAG